MLQIQRRVASAQRAQNCVISRPKQTSRPRIVRVHAVETENKPKNEAQATTEKFGLEAGLLKVLTSKDEGDAPNVPTKTDQAKQLLTQYGSAYLITSISFAAVSFGLCYVAVDSGVDVASLLRGVGLEVNNTSESVGTFAIAYAAHKALSPVRFPPTVALTPVVAKWLKKDAPAAPPSQ